MAQSQITLTSPDGTKTCVIRLGNDGYLYFGNGYICRVADSQYNEPQYN